MEKYPMTQEKFVLKPNYCCGDDMNQLLNRIKLTVNNCDCKDLELDLTGFYLLDAARVGILTTTYHFAKYVEGKVFIIVDNEPIRKNLQKLNFTNAEILVNQNKTGAIIKAVSC